MDAENGGQGRKASPEQVFSSRKADLQKAGFSRSCGDGQDGGTREPESIIEILLEERTENHNRKVLKTFGTSQCISETWIQQPEQHHCLGKEPGSHGLEWLEELQCLELVGPSPGIAMRSFS